MVAEIDVPRWYWNGLAACRVGLGVLADVSGGWVTSSATLGFGAVHSAVHTSSRAATARRR